MKELYLFSFKNLFTCELLKMEAADRWSYLLIDALDLFS